MHNLSFLAASKEQLEEASTTVNHFANLEEAPRRCRVARSAFDSISHVVAFSLGVLPDPRAASMDSSGGTKPEASATANTNNPKPRTKSEDYSSNSDASSSLEP